MHEDNLRETRQAWDRLADDWRLQVGDEGDRNRRLNSDPVLWRMAGDVAGKSVLDFGCGTGYLTRKLRDAGAAATGVDHSEKMIAIAREDAAGIDYLVACCTTLAPLADEQFDLAVSNYVLMDIPDLPAAVGALHRVLKTGGTAVLVFSHPCFPASRSQLDEQGAHYAWPSPYFLPVKCVDPPWDHFTEEFIWFHRPLSDYWRAFTSAGFSVLELDEPHLTPDRYELAESEQRLADNLSRPLSIAWKLRKE